MKSLSTAIFEGCDTPVCKKFNKYQTSYLYKNLGKSKIKFVPKKDCKFKNIKSKFMIERGYTYLHMTYDGASYSDTTHTQVSIIDTQIGMYPWTCSNESSPWYKQYTNLVGFDYNPVKDVTTLTYRVDHYMPVDGDYYEGDIIITVPGNAVDPMVKPIVIDSKKYVEYMKKYLPAKKNYLKSFNWDDEILDCCVVMKSKDTAYIELYLQTGKGYSSHYHSDDYKFEWGFSCYNCKTHKLYDNDHEAQVVRKFVSGFEEFQGGGSNCPQNLIIHIEQELD